MKIIDYIIEKRKNIIDNRNLKCNQLIEQILSAVEETYSYTAKKNAYVDIGLERAWHKKYDELIDHVSNDRIKYLKKADKFILLKTKQMEIYEISRSLRKTIEQHNHNLADRQIPSAYALIGDIEGQTLDHQQMQCIVKRLYNHLVIAGAGTGKTTTIVGRINYLINAGVYQPEDILVLSFTNSSAAEMSERINKETGNKIVANTFHKLGLDIITSVNNIVPKISQLNIRNFVKEQLSGLLKVDSYKRLLSNYLLYNRVVSRSEFEFTSKSEYEEYLKLNPPTTIKNENVKSYGEMDIANFLYQNGVKYSYELPYKVDTRTNEFSQYYPDFYLVDYDIYIEYYAVNRSGEVPSYFSGRKGMSASETYLDAMRWKKQLHQDNHTKMIECYSYEKMEGTLLNNLESKLKEYGVTLTPMSPEELWNIVLCEGDSVLNGVIELFETLINLIKSNNYSIDQLRSIAMGKENRSNNLIIIALLQPIFDAYGNHLKSSGKIDFNDMINLATQYVREGRFKNPYSHVIVDEYQDISKARYNLLLELRKSKNFDLFCVGDDWQSIYRFAGSDINYILNFEKYWGPTQLSRIETTYRFTPSLIDISGKFIARNPAQIKKSIRGNSQDNRFSLGEINGYTDKNAVDFMAATLDELPKNASVFFIGRYSFDVNLLKENDLFICQYDNVIGFVNVIYKHRPDLVMRFITAHKSKGLQADYVFIVNNKKSKMGFPSKTQDNPIINLLLENSEDYPYAEERRLYYVAMTRAKVKVFMLTVKDCESVFVCEIKESYSEQLKKERYQCPKCGGRISIKTGPYGGFFGCDNYKITGCNYKRNIKK